MNISKKSLPLNFDIEGHRGCRGLLPENSIPAFQKAMELGVTTLEMDLVITKDLKVVVSHEPFFNHEISKTPEGKEISEDEEKKYNIFSMDYEQIAKFDVGTKVHPRFKTQQKLKTIKPLFEEVIDCQEKYFNKTGVDFFYNVEIKSTPEGDNFFHPTIDKFCDLVVDVIRKKNTESKTIIQSFDLRALQYLHKKYPNIQLSLLIENNLSPEKNIQDLGFVPPIYSPEFILVDKNLISYAKSLNMKVIPWTVNTDFEIQALIELGVDGVITDYPNIFN